MTKMFEKVTVLPWFFDEHGRVNIALIKHPYAGYQLPAGSVDEGESAELAARRELQEETGLLPLELKFITSEETTGKYLFSDVTFPDYFNLRRGLPVTLNKVVPNGLIEIQYDEYDFNRQPARLKFSITTVCPPECVSEGMTRSFYSCRVERPVASETEHIADGHYFIIQTFYRDKMPELQEPHRSWHAIIDVALPKIMER